MKKKWERKSSLNSYPQLKFTGFRPDTILKVGSSAGFWATYFVAFKCLIESSQISLWTIQYQKLHWNDCVAVFIILLQCSRNGWGLIGFVALKILCFPPDQLWVVQRLFDLDIPRLFSNRWDPCHQYKLQQSNKKYIQTGSQSLICWGHFFKSHITSFTVHCWQCCKVCPNCQCWQI